MKRWNRFPKLIFLMGFFMGTAVFNYSTVFGQADQSRHFRIEKLSDGVYAAIHKLGGYAIGNAGMVDLGDETLIFDTFLSPEAAVDLLNFSRKVTGKPVRYVINSHYHNDHVRGNQVFKPSARIIGTSEIRNLIAENEPLEIEQEKSYAPERLKVLAREYENESDPGKKELLSMWVGYFEAMVRSHPTLVTILPDLTFENKLVMYGSQRHAELVAFDGGHTGSDVILYLPQEKIVFSGDLVFNGAHPYLADGSPDKLLTILQELKNYPVEQLVPGHGEVGNTADIDQMILYLEKISHVVDGLAQQDPESIDFSTVPVPEPFTDWLFPNFFENNLRFIHQQATAEAP